MKTNIILQGDCIEEMKLLEENSVDAIVTDPPYGLEFMGKEWDKFKLGQNIAGGTKAGKDPSTNHQAGRHGRGDCPATDRYTNWPRQRTRLGSRRRGEIARQRSAGRKGKRP